MLNANMKRFFMIYLIVLFFTFTFNSYINPVMESYLEKFIGEKNIEHASAFIRVTIMVPITFWILIPTISGLV